MLRNKIISAILGVTLLFGSIDAAYAANKADQIEYARSTVDVLNVRTEPNLSASIIRKIGKSTRYEVLDKQSDWVKIRLSKESIGWVYQEYIQYESSKPAQSKGTDADTSLKQPTIVHITDVTNLRSGPGTDYKIIGKAQPGHTYSIISTEGEWYKVSLPNKSTAYVASWVVNTDFSKRNGNVTTSSKKDENFAPMLFIYHTHNRESWKNIARNTKGSSVDDPVENITLVGKRLDQLLEEKGIPALSSQDDFAERLKQEKLSYSQSYSVSRKAIEKARKDYPSLSYFFDIHRDADVPREKTTITIEGKTYARILFVIGTGHPRYKENKAFAESLNKLLNEKYPGLSRGILTKSADKGNGEYNQSISPGSILLEIGGTNNTLQESLHTSEAIADVFAQYLNAGKGS